MTSWTENEEGPVCSCGEITVVKQLPDGRWLAVCFDHTDEAGAYTVLPDGKSA